MSKELEWVVRQVRFQLRFGRYLSTVAIFVALFLITCCALSAETVIPAVELRSGEVPVGPSKVELRQNDEGNWRFYVNGEEFPVRGVGGGIAPGALEQLKLAGGNTVRTWGIETLEHKVADGERFIDRAWRLGIMVVPGIWLMHERHGFDYSDPAFIMEQRNRVLDAVRKYKNHPAVLAWGLGNEMEGVTDRFADETVLKEVNELARLIKAEDPHHPIMTVIAFNSDKAKQIMKLCPHIDILGANSYSAAAGIGTALKRIGWTKPFMVTEFGPMGHWEVQTTEWGAPYEQTSQGKAAKYFATHRLVFEVNDGSELCLGTFAFLWDWKQERTSTWFGMFLPTLEKLPQVDAMTKAWTGKWPKNRSPNIRSLSSSAYGQTVARGAELRAKVDVMDPEGDSMSYEWTVVSEATDLRVGGDAEAAPPSHPGLIKVNNAPECVFLAPTRRGEYRLFLVVRDNKGGAATANFPFRVR